MGANEGNEVSASAGTRACPLRRRNTSRAVLLAAGPAADDAPFEFRRTVALVCRFPPAAGVRWPRQGLHPDWNKSSSEREQQ
ncbi:MAG TPA: hypothetical protein VHW45_18420 [Candidatus Sulfotelmatobacter sp.]|nr:hypothetical protein [Candidatus Sulfotelmatobacter sp.]